MFRKERWGGEGILITTHQTKQKNSPRNKPSKTFEINCSTW